MFMSVMTKLRRKYPRFRHKHSEIRLRFLRVSTRTYFSSDVPFSRIPFLPFNCRYLNLFVYTVVQGRCHFFYTRLIICGPFTCTLSEAYT